MWEKIRENKTSTLIILMAFVIVSSTFGRFVYVEMKKHFFTTQNFYFESDKLRAVKAYYQIDNYNGVDQYNITINLNSFKNSKLKAATDISYDLTYACSSNALCSISKTEGIIFSATNTDYFIATITPNAILNDQDMIWIDITAKSTDPYEKELSARFILKVGYFGLSHVITDEVGSPYMELKITNTLDYYRVLEAFGSYNVNDRIDINTFLALSPANKEKCASALIDLNFDPNILLLDTTGSTYLKALDIEYQLLLGHNYVDFISFKIDANSSEVVRFYKKNAQLNYTYPVVNPTSIVTVDYH